jgi:hypothetical protein
MLFIRRVFWEIRLRMNACGDAVLLDGLTNMFH